ncbi:MAG: TonB-dependent receptor [Parachlamydiaceae bacterium]|nr:TonB-dependent receptor [Parachlamydiaceae bacterium]
MYQLRILLFISFIFIISRSYSQNLIKGSVLDTANVAIPYCAMALINASDSSLVKGNIADDNGEFIFEKIKPGNYIIKFNNVGYKTGLSQLIIVDSLMQTFLPPQILKSNGINLNEISVAVFKPIIEFQKGIVVMNVENNILTGGNTVFDLLKRVPGVSLDAQNNISVNGQAGVRFLIDGRLQQIPSTQLISMFMSMPAEAVSTIELIKNPPARYDATGTGGLINLVLKKAKLKGFNASLSQSGSHGDYNRGGTFFSFNYKENRLALFSNFALSYLQFGTTNYFLRNLTDSGGSFSVYSYGTQLPYRNVIYGNVGLEYELNKKTILGFSYNNNAALATNLSDNRLNIIEGNVYNYDNIRFFSHSKQKIQTPSLNFNIQCKFDSLSKLQLSSGYTNYLEQSQRFTTNHFYDNANNEILPYTLNGTILNSDFRIFTQQLDYSKEFKNAFDLEAGFKTSFVENRSNSVFQQNDPVSGLIYSDTAFSFQYKYHERITAGYFILGKSLKKLDLRVGLRTEHTLINANDNPKPFTLHRNYINFFPSGSLDYKLNDKNNLQTIYSYRIGRPSYDQMNPVRTFYDQFNNGAGNPYLKPEYSHIINLDYSYNHFITLSSSYQTTKDNIYNYSYGNIQTKATIDSTFNFAKISNSSLSVFVQKQIKWFTFQVFVGSVYRSNLTIVNELPVNLRSYLYYGNVNTEFLLPKNFKFQIQANYNSLSRDGIQTYYPNGVVNLTVFKSFFNKKLDISISMFDIFYTDIHPYSNQVGSQYSYYTERNDTRRIRAFVAWKFGKMRINKTIEQNNNSDKERLKLVE